MCLRPYHILLYSVKECQGGVLSRRLSKHLFIVFSQSIHQIKYDVNSAWVTGFLLTHQSVYNTCNTHTVDTVQYTVQQALYCVLTILIMVRIITCWDAGSPSCFDESECMQEMDGWWGIERKGKWRRKQKKEGKERAKNRKIRGKRQRRTEKESRRDRNGKKWETKCTKNIHTVNRKGKRKLHSK